MNTAKQGVPATKRNSFKMGCRLTRAGGIVAAALMLAGARAEAQPVRFRYVGGHWSHTRHYGWHRYWGGPSIGFYYAPSPVYVVPGYEEPSYYSGPDFWYSNPSFGLNLNFGGGGYYSGPYYHRAHYDNRWHGDDRRWHGDDRRWQGDNRRWQGDGGGWRGGRDRR